MAQSGREFKSEAALVAEAIRQLRRHPSKHWGNLKIACEFFYRSGRTDIIALSPGKVVFAFEAKLADWRTAVHQAHRNRCFAHKSYVLLPERVARRVMAHRTEFERRQIGLCYVSNNRLVQALEPAPHTPWQEWLAESAIKMILECEKK